jgi:hypothetical protein
MQAQFAAFTIGNLQIMRGKWIIGQSGETLIGCALELHGVNFPVQVKQYGSYGAILF